MSKAREGFAILFEEVRGGFDRLRRDVVYTCLPIDVARAEIALEALEMTAKTPAERQADFRARKRSQQHQEVRGIFAHEADHAAIKAYAVKLAKKRAKSD